MVVLLLLFILLPGGLPFVPVVSRRLGDSTFDRTGWRSCSGLSEDSAWTFASNDRWWHPLFVDGVSPYPPFTASCSPRSPIHSPFTRNSFARCDYCICSPCSPFRRSSNVFDRSCNILSIASKWQLMSCFHLSMILQNSLKMSSPGFSWLTGLLLSGKAFNPLCGMLKLSRPREYTFTSVLEWLCTREDHIKRLKE